ncbi:MAG: TonB-dependent receptor [Acidobacteria bacterium]|nr:TonB-dependent receptor [Acidobacteriota bacterium]
MRLLEKNRSLLLPLMIAALMVSSLVLPVKAKAAGSAKKNSFGIIRGIVRDHGGQPISDATVAIFRVGTSKLLRQVRSGADGKFLLRTIPGTYSLLAVAQGYNPVTLPEVSVGRSVELDYGFKLERAGQGKTLPERRLDRNNPKWVHRSSTLSRSIYQNQEGDTLAEGQDADADVADERTAENRMRPGDSVVETYTAVGDQGAYTGFNYAANLTVNDRTDVVVAAQTGIGKGAPQRLDARLKYGLSDDHNLRLNTSVALLGSVTTNDGGSDLGIFSIQASDEWRVREGVILVYGVDYSKFVGAGGDFSLTPRLGFQYDINPKTRFRAAYTAPTDQRTWTREIELENAQVIFREPVAMRDIAVTEDDKPLMARSQRLEFGLERVLDNRSSIEATLFSDTVYDRGVGMAAVNFVAGSPVFDEFTGNQTGAAKGIRLVYSRRISGRMSAGGGYSFGSGQRLNMTEALGEPGDIFKNDLFHTFFGQVEADLGHGTNVKTVFRLSPQATVFAIDPFQGRLAIYDPSLSILVTQHLPTLGLPFRAEAVVDARNILDVQTGVNSEAGSLKLLGHGRSLRGSILVRF